MNFNLYDDDEEIVFRSNEIVDTDTLHKFVRTRYFLRLAKKYPDIYNELIEYKKSDDELDKEYYMMLCAAVYFAFYMKEIKPQNRINYDNILNYESYSTDSLGKWTLIYDTSHGGFFYLIIGEEDLRESKLNNAKNKIINEIYNKVKMEKKIKLNGKDIRKMVNESVKRILKENNFDQQDTDITEENPQEESWVAVDMYGDEWLFKEKPIWNIDGWEVEDELDYKLSGDEPEKKLKRGTIQRLTGRKMTYKDQPIQIS